MKPRLTFWLVFALAVTGLAYFAAETNRPARRLAIDPRAYQMQAAVLRDQDLQKIATLLQQGVDINAPIGCGTYAPLDGAVSTGNLDLLKFLLAHGAKPRGRELANAAFMGGDPETPVNFAKALLAAGVNPNATNDYSTPLTSAAYRENTDLVALLLAQPGIQVNATDVDGYTALMWAAEHASTSIVEMLLKAGANPNLENRRGQTAAALAEAGITARQAIISKLQAKPR